jgi:hypothetical protein
MRAVTKVEIINAGKRGVTDFYAGGASGFDMYAALTVLTCAETYPELGLKLHIVMPHHGFRRKLASEIESYKYIFAHSASVEYVHARYQSDSYAERNKRLTEYGADLGIVYAEVSHKSGGTYQTIREARKRGIPVINVCDKAKNFADMEYLTGTF